MENQVYFFQMAYGGQIVAKTSELETTESLEVIDPCEIEYMTTERGLERVFKPFSAIIGITRIVLKKKDIVFHSPIKNKVIVDGYLEGLRQYKIRCIPTETSDIITASPIILKGR